MGNRSRWLAVVAAILLAGCGTEPGPEGGDAEPPEPDAPSAAAEADEAPATPVAATDPEPEHSEDAQPAAVEPEDPSPTTDLAEVDWRALGWQTDCTLSGEVETIFLDVPDEPGESWPDGWLQHDPNPDFPSMIFTVLAGTPAIGVATADDRQVAVFEANCFLGNDSVTSLEAWTTGAEGEPLQLPQMLLLSKFDGALGDIEVVDGVVRVVTAEGEDNDAWPHLNGYPIEVVTDWRLIEDRWQGRVISRVDTRVEGTDAAQAGGGGQQPDDAAPAGAPTDLSWCDQASQSPEALVRCLVAAYNVGEPQRAAGLATADVLDRLAQERSLRELDWRFDECHDDGTCWLSEPMDDWIHGLGIEVQVDPSGDGYVATFLEVYG